MQAEVALTDVQAQLDRRSLPWQRTLGFASLVVAILFFCVALIAYLDDAVAHSGVVLDWFDLNVYNDAGLITRQLPSYLYIWEQGPNVKFTYTPFAGLVFAGSSYLSWAYLRWTMTIASLASIPVTAWLTLGAMGRRGTGRAAMALAVAAVSIWLEPVTKAMFLGQIEPLLLLLVVWDVTRDDSRRWKGVGIGLAAGIKLVPLLFIPYLFASGKVRQGIVASCVFLGSVLTGFIVLPGPSEQYWLTGYFFKPGRTGGVDSLVNQSLLGMLARHAGTASAASPLWLPVALAVSAGGIAGAALLSRAGKPGPGWVLIGITSVLVSPISWDHHWVWIVPVLAMIGGLAMSGRGVLRWLLVLAGLGTAALFGSWPGTYSGPLAFVPEKGLLGWFVRPPVSYLVTALHGWQLVTYNLYVLYGIVLFLIMLTAAVLVRRRKPSEPPEPPAPPPKTAPDRASPISAVLARAEAVLRSQESLAARKTAKPAEG